MESQGTSRKNSSEELKIEQLEATMDQIFLPSSPKLKSGKTLNNIGCENVLSNSKVTWKKTCKLKDSKDEIFQRINQLRRNSSSTVDELNMKMKRLVSGTNNTKTEKNAGTSVEHPSKLTQDVGEVRFYIVQEIQAKCQQDEDACLARELEKVRLASSGLMTVGNADDSFPGNLWCNKQPKNSMSIELDNYLNVSLSNPKTYDPRGYLQDLNPTTLPKIIGGSRKEKIIFPFPENMNSAGVLCSFKINTSDIRLVLLMQRTFDIQSVAKIDWSDEQIFAIAFIPEETETDKSLWEEMLSMTLDRKFRPDKKRSHNSSIAENLIVKSGKYRAQASITSTGPSFTSLSVEIWSVDAETETLAKKHNTNTERNFLKVLEEGCTLNGGIAIDIPGKISCAVEIYNCLNICLEDPFTYMPGGSVLPHIVATISPLSKGFVVTTHTKQLEAVLSYRIQDTDIRIAILFRINNTNVEGATTNDFAVGLIPLHCPTDGNLMSSLVKSDWRTRNDKKFSNGLHDELFVEIRNIRLKAKITGTERAILKIIVSTF